MEKKTSDKIKKNLPVVVLAAAGLLLIIIGGTIGKTKAKTEEPYTDVGYYTSYLEGRIEELCKTVDGISEASVLLTLDSSTEYVYGTDGGADFIIISDSAGEHAVKLCEIYPKIRGVAVVCTGGDTPQVKETVVKLLSASLGLPTSRIEVAGGS